LYGGAGSDIFRWELNDGGSTSSVAVDTIKDFNTAIPGAGGDTLDLRDLLSPTGGTAGGLDNFLHFRLDGSGNTVIDISTTGQFSNNNNVGGPPSNVSNNDDQQIVLQGVNLIGSFTSDQQVIQDLLTKGKLIVD
jgi:hypothetical protein